ncbi:MAG TPA: hypothetical protein VK550_21400 [Polyangiaceae bacterium]|nr:hypothetical protein [Polyangiaceae bacterium]
MSDPIGGPPRAWIAELSNQLVGRIKNKLLAHGAEVDVTTPVVLRGELLAPLDARNKLPPRAFASEGGNVFVWIELDTDPTLVLSLTPRGGGRGRGRCDDVLIATRYGSRSVKSPWAAERW